MSKIQKALKALRESQEQQQKIAPAASARTPLVDGRRQHRSEPSNSAASNGARVVDDSASVDRKVEPAPRKSISINLKALAADGLVANSNDEDVISQQFRRVKRPILQSAFESNLPVGENANVIMIASALPGAGKSFCAFNLAQSISLERDVGVVLVDADVLKPGISHSLGLQEEQGLIDYLVDPNVELEDILVATDLNDIVVIPAGRSHAEATELLASRRMQILVSLLSKRYMSRVVVFDTPPLLITNEAQVLAQQMGQIALVIEARVSSQESVMRALGLLDRNKPINAILNKSRSASSGGYQSDDYGYYPYRNDSVGGPRDS